VAVGGAGVALIDFPVGEAIECHGGGAGENHGENDFGNEPSAGPTSCGDEH